MALSSDALTTLANLKVELGITTSSEDARLERLINRVTKWIETETGRKLKARNYNGGSDEHEDTAIPDQDYIYFDGGPKNKGGHTTINEMGQGEFFVPVWPIQKFHATNNPNAETVELAVLSSRSSSIEGGEQWDTTALIEWDDFIVDYPNGVIRLLSGRFTAGQRNYRLKCTAGYHEGDAQPYVPEDLEGLCLELCQEVYNDTANLQSETIGTWSRTFNTAKGDPMVSSLLASYSRPVL